MEPSEHELLVNACAGKSKSGGGLNVDQIQIFLAAHGLPTDGTRRDLVARLKTLIDTEVLPTPPPPPPPPPPMPMEPARRQVAQPPDTHTLTLRAARPPFETSFSIHFPQFATMDASYEDFTRSVLTILVRMEGLLERLYELRDHPPAGGAGFWNKNKIRYAEAVEQVLENARLFHYDIEEANEIFESDFEKYNQLAKDAITVLTAGPKVFKVVPYESHPPPMKGFSSIRAPAPPPRPPSLR